MDINPNIRDTSLGEITFQFSELVSNFELADLTLMREGSPVSLSEATLTADNGNRNWTLTLPNHLTIVDGRYEISLAQGSLTDLVGNAIASSASESWFTGHTATALPPINFSSGKNNPTRARGTNRSEALQGTPRNNVLLALGGNDFLISGRGNDSLNGGKGRDRLEGGANHDRLNGESGNDRLNGGRGHDVLIGDVGNDTLTGGIGWDTFVYQNLGEGKDIITDFNSSEDLIDLRSIMSRAEFSSNNAFAQFVQFVQLQQVGANTEVQIDADGNGSSQVLITLVTLQNTSMSAVSARNMVMV